MSFPKILMTAKITAEIRDKWLYSDEVTALTKTSSRLEMCAKDRYLHRRHQEQTQRVLHSLMPQMLQLMSLASEIVLHAVLEHCEIGYSNPYKMTVLYSSFTATSSISTSSTSTATEDVDVSVFPSSPTSWIHLRTIYVPTSRMDTQKPHLIFSVPIADGAYRLCLVVRFCYPE
ncbi:hypothetical protein Plhal703r1_c33g0124721 [Plasmopara halstedii]